jgi:hypothetical protein
MTDTTVTNIASFRVPEPTDLDRLAASLEALALNFCRRDASQDGKRRRLGSRRPLPELPEPLPLQVTIGSN